MKKESDHVWIWICPGSYAKSCRLYVMISCPDKASPCLNGDMTLLAPLLVDDHKDMR